MSARARVALALGAVSALVAVLLLGGVLADAPTPAEGAAPAAAADADGALAALVAGLSTGDTAGFVGRLERRVAAAPADAQALTVLALAYQQRARETGDPSYYTRSEEALRRASVGGSTPLLVQGRASLANARHEFRKGLRLAHAALARDAESAGAYGALGDALLNLGRYDAAFRAYDRMVVLAPGISSLARVASARELLGRPAGAAEAIRFALELDHAVPEHAAWARVQLGNVAFNRGRLAEATRAYRSALAGRPGYVHARAGLARVDAAGGRYPRAIARLRGVVAELPLPAYAIQLGDTLHAAGRERDARAAYALVTTIERLFAANGVRTELQTAVFELDHGRNVAAALARARTAFRIAPSIYAEDALAWGLLRAGRCAEARSHSERALRLGTRDALLVFHRAMIERCLGRASAGAWFGRALALNPHFSLLWAPVARRHAEVQLPSARRKSAASR